MKQLLLSLLFILSGSFVQRSNAQTTTFNVKRGTNISHWLSQSSKRGGERSRYFTESDVKRIAAMGFDHIRLPIDEEQMWDKKGQRFQEAFDLMHDAIGWCKKANLKIIVDLHILRSHHFNNNERPLWTDTREQKKFYIMWKRLSNELRKYPNDFLAYELMNEAVADDPNDWNKLIAGATNIIRVAEPRRTIIVGSNRWQSVHTFKDLKVPANDPNIMLSFHFYEPFVFTHYETSWTFLKDYHGGAKYPGVGISDKKLAKSPLSSQLKHYARKYDREVLKEMINMAYSRAQSLGLKLYCGEFGVYKKSTPKPDRLKWYEDVVSIFDELNIGYTCWDYKGSFGLISPEGEPYVKLIEIVTNKKQ